MPSQKKRRIQIPKLFNEVPRRSAAARRDLGERKARVAQAMRELADLLVLPSSNLPAEPNYHTVQDLFFRKSHPDRISSEADNYIRQY